MRGGQDQQNACVPCKKASQLCGSCKVAKQHSLHWGSQRRCLRPGCLCNHTMPSMLLLCRCSARDILQHVTQLGLPDRQGEECRSLLESIEAAAAGSQWAA